MKLLQALLAVFACAVLPLHAAPPTAIDLGILGDDTSELTLDTIGSSVGDTELGVYDAAGNLLDDNDDIGGGILHSEVVVGNLAEGTYYAAVSAYNTSFGPADFAVSGGGVSGGIVLNYSDGLDVAGTATGSLDGADGVDGVAWFSFEIEVQRAVTLTALQQERTYGDALTLDETAFSVLDLDGDAALPNGEVIDTVNLVSAGGVDHDTTANAGSYVDNIAITGQNGSNGFEAGNYDLSYVANNLVVNQRAVTLTALQQERTYGDVLSLDGTAFSVLDLDGDAILPNGEVIDTVDLVSAGGVDQDTTADAGLYRDNIIITLQVGSNGFNPGNYDIVYVTGDLRVRPATVELDLGERLAFRYGRGRGLWGESHPSGILFDFRYNGGGAFPGTLGEHSYEVESQDANYVPSESTGLFRVVERSYEIWRARFIDEQTAGRPGDDPDHDGVSNLLEYALDTDPLSPNVNSPVIVGPDGAFSGLVAKEMSGISLIFEASQDLQNWREIEPIWSDRDQARHWRWTSPEGQRNFLRLRVERVSGATWFDAVSLGSFDQPKEGGTIDTLGSSFDTELGLFRADGSFIAENDDTQNTSQSSLDLSALVPGRYFLALGGFNTLFGTVGTGFFEASVLAEPENGQYVLSFPGSQVGGILPPDSIRWFSFEIR